MNNNNEFYDFKNITHEQFSEYLKETLNKIVTVTYTGLFDIVKTYENFDFEDGDLYCFGGDEESFDWIIQKENIFNIDYDSLFDATYIFRIELTDGKMIVISYDKE